MRRGPSFHTRQLRLFKFLDPSTILNIQVSRTVEAMIQIIKRRRGRPPGSTVVHPDLLAEVWIAVWLKRISERIRTGKTPSVKQACQALVVRGGIISVIGGDQAALEEENGRRKKRWLRYRIAPAGSSLTPDATGTTFADHAITNAGTLQARYNEADKLASSDRRVRVAWVNISRQRLGRPTKRTRSSATFRGSG